ncbi:MAG TPA: outer membrane beta-barrel protein [Bryobacteraceae bacterium]|nr:outer membrane beta-barrel protein [Bryobacteraceae bacterium]
MRRIAVTTMFLAALAASCFGQQWEFGGSGGAGFLSNVNVSSPAGSATAGFETGGAFGGYFGQNLYPHWSGEIRYMYLQNDLHIQSGSTNASFNGNAQVLHYDILYHTNRKGSMMQAFVAVGGGMKVFRGTGTPEAYQPNYQFGYLTNTQQLKPMGDAGAGLRFELKPRIYMRLEFRDYITPFPEKIIAPAPGAKFGKILNDFVPMASISYEK